VTYKAISKVKAVGGNQQQGGCALGYSNVISSNIIKSFAL
jgi:hypothetical protein